MNKEEDSLPSAKKARSNDGTPVPIPAVVSPDVTEEAVAAPVTEDDQDSKLQQAIQAATDPATLLDHYNVLLAKQANGMAHAYTEPIPTCSYAANVAYYGCAARRKPGF